MKSIFRFYKPKDDNIEALKTPYIYLYSAKEWEKDGEFNFTIDIGKDEDYKAFLEKNLKFGFELLPSSEGYKEFRAKRIKTLSKYGFLRLVDTPVEYDTLMTILFSEAKSSEGIKEREKLIRENLFFKSGICCFTKYEEAIGSGLHWNNFAQNGTGFCVEYDLEILENFFYSNNSGVVGSKIKYCSKPPSLKFYDNNPEQAAKNVKEVHFSLKQSLIDEKEYRFSKLFIVEMAEKDKGRKQIIPQQSLLSVTAGPNMSTENLEKLRTSIELYSPSLGLFKIVEQYNYYHRFRL